MGLKIAGRATFESKLLAAWRKGKLQKEWSKGVAFRRASPSSLRYLGTPYSRLWPFSGPGGILVDEPPENGRWFRTLKEHFVIA